MADTPASFRRSNNSINNFATRRSIQNSPFYWRKKCRVYPIKRMHCMCGLNNARDFRLLFWFTFRSSEIHGNSCSMDPYIQRRNLPSNQTTNSVCNHTTILGNKEGNNGIKKQSQTISALSLHLHSNGQNSKNLTVFVPLLLNQTIQVWEH